MCVLGEGGGHRLQRLSTKAHYLARSEMGWGDTGTSRREAVPQSPGVRNVSGAKRDAVERLHLDHDVRRKMFSRADLFWLKSVN